MKTLILIIFSCLTLGLSAQNEVVLDSTEYIRTCLDKTCSCYKANEKFDGKDVFIEQIGKIKQFFILILDYKDCIYDKKIIKYTYD